MANKTSKSNNCMKVDYVTITNADFSLKKDCLVGVFLFLNVVGIFAKK